MFTVNIHVQYAPLIRHMDQLHKRQITFLSPIIVAYPGAKLTPLSSGNGIAP